MITPYLIQAATAELESQLNDYTTWLATQETETRKAESKFQFRMAESEKLKTNFEAEKTTWADEKAVLMQRAEKAETTLQEVTTELTGLKHRVTQMVSAIFGERPCQSSTMKYYFDHITRHLIILRYIQVPGAAISIKMCL